MADESKPAILPAEGIDMRRAPRVGACLGVTWIEDGGVEGSGQVMNISATGALIEGADPPMKPGNDIRCEFSLFPGAAPIKLHALVVRVTDESCAIEFIEMDARTRKVLKLAITKARGLRDDKDSHLVRSDSE